MKDILYANGIENKFFLRFLLFFSFIFFFLTEWRWEAMLLGMPDIKPHIVTAVTSVFVIYIGISSLGKRGFTVWLLLLFILYLIVIAALYAKELAGYDAYKLTREFGSLAIALALFIASSNKAFWQYIYSNPQKILALFALFIFTLFALLYYTDASRLSHFNLRNAVQQSGLSFNSEYGVSYQSFGDKLAVITFVVLSLKISKRMKYLAGVLAFAALYICGSKAAMLGYIFACCAYYVIFLFSTKQYVKLCAILLLFCFALSVGFVAIVGNTYLQNSNNWLIRTVANGVADNSVSSRHEIEERNQKTRTSRLLVGDYKFDYKLGTPGTYTHSALGIIDYYGLPIFVFFVGIWLYLLIRLALLMKRVTPIVTAALMTMLYYTLLFSIARFPPANYLTFWALGIAAFALSRRPESYRQRLIPHGAKVEECRDV